ncbi:hypothetical protein BHE74_00021113 [Ensete ventricosum]|uniref:Uncharacterized protein n=1 Tax=Ensete ventricosum TaxID=4639 RepID=A0A445M8Q0_ENSVE|nr:hypothetical protein BHE74_00021113 [Ensete ventricosum]RZR70626.1 hypothetical protein BHM03_00000885 [Ensete ventricosum]
MGGTSGFGSGSRLLEWWSSGRLLTPAKRSGRVGSRRDLSNGQVSSVVGFCHPLLRRGVGAFIMNTIGHSYLISLLPLLLTVPLLLTIPSVVLATRRAPAGKGCRPCPPYLCQVGHTTADSSMPVSDRLPRVGSAMSAGQVSEGARTWLSGQHLPYHSFPPGKTFSRCPIRVLKMRSCVEPPVCGDVRLVLKVG